MKEGESVKRLEQALNLWEDLCFVIRKILPLYRKEGLEAPCPMEGPILNAPTFRNYLLNSYQEDDFDFDRYVGATEIISALKSLYWFPLSIFSWTKYSRRVFHLTPELHTLLSATSLEKIQWKDIDWPLESFVITLGDPLIDEKGNRFDCLLVSNLSKPVKNWREKGARLVNIAAFSNKLAGYRKMDMSDRDKISKLAKRGNRNELDLKREKLFRIEDGIVSFTVVVDQIYDNYVTNFAHELSKTFERALPLAESPEHAEHIRKLIEVHADDDEYATYSLHSRMLYIVTSFCLYLSSLPTTERVQYLPSSSNGQNAQENGKTISDISKVLTVSCKHTLNLEDYAVLEQLKQSRKTGQNKCVHWRRGHWRKKPRMGQDLNAPKVVHVKPSLINRSLLSEGTLPPGSKTVFK